MFSPIFGKLSRRPSQWCVWSLIYLEKWWNKWLIYLYFCSKRSWALIFMVWLMFSPIFGKLSWRLSQWSVWLLIYFENWWNKWLISLYFSSNALKCLFLWFDSCSATFSGSSREGLPNDMPILQGWIEPITSSGFLEPIHVYQSQGVWLPPGKV